ncbi:MAG TPA: tetratricopeptide repeat protein, partial [Xanthomonadales bacterium]|nr:tetratricopeptide repeat protein [Xanthomonadales bacterium]
AMMNLGNVYQEQEQFSEATECYRKAIELRPTEAAALSNLSVSLRRQEHLKEAIEAGLSAVALDPEYLIAWYNLGNAYKVSQRFKSAITSYQKAIELKPDLSLAHDGLCQSTFQLEHRSLFGRASFSKTKKAYEQWLACEPDNALAQFMLEAIGGKSRLLRAPDAVVRNMFDQFAPSFETHLQSLNYRLPQMLTPLLEDLLGPPQASVKIVDGGCGTGLCAAALKPWARSLTGVDLSTAMLEKARQKALYDALFEAELTTFMQQHDGAFDLAVYADTLCYFGDLQDILRATAEALDNQGTLLLTLEASAFSQDVTRYQLQPQGRYTHSPSYVENTLQACGFAHILIRSDSTRTEVGRPVDGLLVSARKP